MQRDSGLFNGRVSPADAYGVGNNTHNTPLGGHYTYGAPVTPAFGAGLGGSKHDFPSPLNGVEFQPSATCPKNFIIFDQSENKSLVMFHPAVAHKLHCPNNFNEFAGHAYMGGNTSVKINEHENQFSSLPKEDTDDIDALLSSEEDDDEEEDDVVSTGRTPSNWVATSPDYSCSPEGLKSCKLKSAYQKSFSSGASSGERKRERMKKMVKALRGIIPGGDRMDTPAVLDEAVKYLKSLKVEVKKLGIQNFEN